MDSVVDLMLSSKSFLAAQLILFAKSYFYFWVFFTFLEMIQPDEKRPHFSKHQVNEILFGLFIAICLWPFDSAISVDSIKYYINDFIIIGDQILSLHRLPMFAQVMIGLLFMDFSQYLYHRLMHSKALWAFHATHHSAIELRSSTHFRIHPVDFFVSKVFTLIVLFSVGMNLEVLGLVMAIIVVNNMWLHTNIDMGYGKIIGYLISSPNYHKWHHATDKEAQNKNYANMFPFLDVIGGTYYYPKNKKPQAFGVAGVPKNAKLHQTFIGPFLYPFIRKSRVIEEGESGHSN